MNYVAHICCLETLTTSGAKHVLMKLFSLEKFSPYLVEMFLQSSCICELHTVSPNKFTNKVYNFLGDTVFFIHIKLIIVQIRIYTQIRVSIAVLSGYQHFNMVVFL